MTVPTTLGRHDIWPPADQHTLVTLDLTPFRAHDPALVAAADRLVAVADATWALTRAQALSPDLEDRLNQQAAEHVRGMADCTSGPATESLLAQATAIAAGDPVAQMRLMLDHPVDDISVVYGPFRTWSSKDGDPRPAALVGVRNSHTTQVVTAIDRLLASAVAAVGALLEVDELGFWHVPDLVVTDLVACGGEANCFPKHFALFLPEDTGLVVDHPATRTVVYGNVYAARYAAISRPLGEAFLDPAARAAASSERDALVGWFRGHDAAHFLGPRSRHVDYLVGYSGQIRGALLEAFADVVGFLLITRPEILRAARVTHQDLAAVFLSELLRYYRRGSAYFPDSAAARIELGYLVEQGHLAAEMVDGNTRLRWDVEGLQRGMGRLARELAAALFQGDTLARQRLVDRCEGRDPPWLEHFRAQLRAGSRSIGDSLVFCHDA